MNVSPYHRLRAQGYVHTFLWSLKVMAVDGCIAQAVGQGRPNLYPRSPWRACRADLGRRWCHHPGAVLPHDQIVGLAGVGLWVEHLAVHHHPCQGIGRQRLCIRGNTRPPDLVQLQACLCLQCG